eukprot:UN33124
MAIVAVKEELDKKAKQIWADEQNDVEFDCEFTGKDHGLTIKDGKLTAVASQAEKQHIPIGSDVLRISVDGKEVDYSESELKKISQNNNKYTIVFGYQVDKVNLKIFEEAKKKWDTGYHCSEFGVKIYDKKGEFQECDFDEDKTERKCKDIKK